VSELTYRFGRAHLVAALVLVALLATGAMGYLVARDLALAPTSAAATAATPTPTAASTPGAVAAPAGTAARPGTAARQVVTQVGGANQAAIQGGEVTIGAVITQSGLGDETPVYHGLDTAIKELNAAGGIRGARVNLEVLDDGTSPDRGQAALRRLVENDHVFALVGECAPLTDIDAGPYFAQQAVPVFGACFTSNDQYTNPQSGANQSFSLLLKPQTEGTRMADYLVKQMGATNPGIVSLAVNVLHDSFAGAQRALASHNCGDEEEVSLAHGTYDDVVLNEMNHHCDGIVLNLDPPRIVDWMEAAQRYGYKPKRVALTGFDSSVVQQGGAYANDMVTYYAQYMPTVDTNQPAVSHYVQEMHTYHPEDPNVNLALVGYLAGTEFGREMNAVPGTITRQAFINQLYAGNLDTGFTPPLRWTPHDHEAITDCRFYKLENGQFQPASDWYGG